jgi:hypothetical protein
MTIFLICLKITICTNVVGAHVWSRAEVVSSESSKGSYRASLAVDANGTIHVAWKDNTNYGNSGRDWDIFYKKKTKGGNWTNTEVVSTESTGTSQCLWLAVDANGTVHIAWKDNTNYSNSGRDWDIFYKKKTKGGNWTKMEVVSTESTNTSGCPCLAVESNGTVHVVWSDGSNYSGSGSDYDIFYKKKTKGGNWTTTEVVSTESNDDCHEPSLAVDDYGTVHVFWEERSDFRNSGNDYDIFYKKKTKGGNWTTTEVVSTESTGNSLIPCSAVDNNGTIHVAWVDNTDYMGSGADHDIFYKKKPQYGNWTTTEVVSVESTSIRCNWPSLIVDTNGTVHVAWNDNTNYASSGADHDIFYKMKPTGGNWTSAKIVSAGSTNDSYFPSLGVDPAGKVHIVWWDDEGRGNSVILYSRYPSKPVENDKIPGFGLTLLVASIAIFLMIRRKMKKN